MRFLGALCHGSLFLLLFYFMCLHRFSILDVCVRECVLAPLPQANKHLYVVCVTSTEGHKGHRNPLIHRLKRKGTPAFKEVSIIFGGRKNCLS